MVLGRCPHPQQNPATTQPSSKSQGSSCLHHDMPLRSHLHPKPTFPSPLPIHSCPHKALGKSSSPLQSAPAPQGHTGCTHPQLGAGGRGWGAFHQEESQGPGGSLTCVKSMGIVLAAARRHQVTGLALSTAWGKAGLEVSSAWRC